MILTKEIAEKIVAEFLKDESDMAMLTGFTSIDDAGAEVLVSVRRDPTRRIKNMQIWAPNLKTLSESTAKILSKHEGDLCFPALEHISPRTAASLASTQCNCLSLNSLSTVSGEVGVALASFTGGHLYLGLKSISVSVAEALARHEKWLYLDRIETLSDEAAEALSHLPPCGWLGLNGLSKISDAAAESLGRRDGWLSLKALESLSPVAARSLSRLQYLETSTEVRKIINKARKLVTAPSSAKTAQHLISPAGCPESVFEWVLGGVLAVRVPRKKVLECLDKNGGKGWPWEPVSPSLKGWTLLNGINASFTLENEEGGQFVSAALDCMVVHLVYDDGSGYRGYTIYESGKKAEECHSTLGSDENEDDEKVTFSSAIAALPPETSEKPVSSDRFLEIANIRFKALKLFLPSKLD